MTEPSASNYPSALDTDTTLGGDAVNLTSLELDTSMDASVTTVSVTEDISGVNVPCYLLLGTELIYATAKGSGNFTSCDRGAGGTSAASHTSGDTVYVVYAANQFNQLKRAIIAIETELGAAPSASLSTLVARLAVNMDNNGIVAPNLPDGTLINGKISPTVASNNLTVAIKTTAGTDPSATDPVYVWINGTKRSITSALSVTLNAGTNWFNAGSSTLATYSIDYFVYLSWRAASSAVVIGFSRIPTARVYSGFSATTTNEKHGAFSTAPAATDDVVIIGRFAATLSASASYNWSVPTYTSDTLVQTPIYMTRRLSYNPICSASAGSFTTVSSVGDYKLSHDEVTVLTAVTITDVGTATGNLIVTAPISTLSSYYATGAGRENGVTGYMLFSYVVNATHVIYKYDGSSILTSSYVPTDEVRYKF